MFWTFYEYNKLLTKEVKFDTNKLMYFSYIPNYNKELGRN